jgi:hypothetical protein
MTTIQTAHPVAVKRIALAHRSFVRKTYVRGEARTLVRAVSTLAMDGYEAPETEGTAWQFSTCGGVVDTGCRRVVSVFRSVCFLLYNVAGRGPGLACTFVVRAAGNGSPGELLPPFNVVVTGSTKGVGLALAKEFLRAGDNVIVSSRSGA